MPQKTNQELQVGNKAPDFSIPDQNGKEVRLSNLKGKWVVLYFYPKDDTPGCTTEAIQFTQTAKEFEKLGAVILGVSKDTCEDHQKFIQKHKLGVTLLADPDRQAIDAYGVWGLKKFMGKEFMGITRSTFLIDPRGNLAAIWPKVSPDGHAAEVKAKIAELQAR